MQNQRKDSIHLNKCKLPLSFIKNNGQEDQRAQFTTNYKGRRFFFSSDRITSVELEPLEEQVPAPGHFPDDFEEPDQPRNGVALELSFTNSNPDIIPAGISQQEGYHHYLKGNDSSKWQKGIPHYKELRYNSIWEGVDLEIYGGEDGLKMNWLLDKPENVSSIRLHWEGADRLEIDEAGNLLIQHALGTLTDLAPIAYQEINGAHVPLDCAYQLYGGFDFGFELTGDYSAEVPIVIDPIIQYVTYLGGSTNQTGTAIAVDNEGFAYVTGYTYSADFPVTPGAFQTGFGGDRDVFVTKFAANGESLIYSTYLGGDSSDYAIDISLDLQNCPYVSGYTSSLNFPVSPGAFQTTRGFLFVTKIAEDGMSLIYSTFFGKSHNDRPRGNAVDLEGCAYIIGSTQFDSSIPTTPGAFQRTTTSDSSIIFITKFSPDGGSLVYSTYLSGSISDECYGIALDTVGHAYITGHTLSPDFPVTPGAFQTTFHGSPSFITKLEVDGSSLVYSTFLGGSGNGTVCNDITVDTLDCACVTGTTYSADFPVTPDAFQVTIGNATSSAFVTKFSPSGDSLIGSTFLAGSVGDGGNGIKTDRQNRIYVTGNTQSPDFPITPDVIPSSLKGLQNIFISIFTEDLTHLLVSYYLGGSNVDGARHITVGREGAIYTTGATNSPDFPVTTGAFQTNLTGTNSGYVAKSAFAFFQHISVNLVKF